MPGHPNDIPGKSHWKTGKTGVDETQEAWQKDQGYRTALGFGIQEKLLVKKVKQE